MGWLFNRKPKEETPPLVIQPPVTSRVEIELHKGASEDAAKKADQVNQHVKKLLVENGFTLKIALAAGAQISHKKQGGKN